MKKKTKKIIVNSLTLSRIIGMFLLPILFNILSAPVFLIVVASLLFTDFLDGLFARKFKVSTIGGSLLDMSADKLFGFSVLVILSNMYPIMTIPLLLECSIMGINIIGAMRGNSSKSSEIGRIKTWIMGLSICSLFLVGLNEDIIKLLNNYSLKKIFDYINSNKELIKNVSITSTIVSESIVLTDYSFKALKGKNNKNTLKELKKLRKELINRLKQKEYYENILFNERYNDITNELTLKEKLLPNKEEEEKIKKLTLN